MKAGSLSPYERAVIDQLDELQPVLREYFRAIPPGHTGYGEGVFSTVGSQKKLLQYALKILDVRGVVPAGWHTNVPFLIVNRSEGKRRTSKRHFFFPGTTWTMNDSVTTSPAGTLVDALGSPPTVAAAFTARVEDAAFVMESRAVSVRFGSFTMRIPRFVRPVVRLREEYVDALSLQRVTVTIDAPFIGRIYEYGGTFTYRIEKDGE